MSQDDHAKPARQRGKTVHGELANAGHRVLAPDDAEVEAYLEVALDAPPPARPEVDRPGGAIPRGEPSASEPDTVVVLDFGSQLAQLIARRVRELHVYSELLPHDTPYAELIRRRPRAIILSGGPNSVYDEGAPKPDPAIWAGRIPVLGICYGAQLMALELGGDVLPATRREYGPATVTITADDPLFAGLDRDQPVWMSHGDSITRLRPASGDRPDALDAVRGLVDRSAALYGIQFHPEVVHTPGPRRPAQLRHRHRRRAADLDAANFIGVHRQRDPLGVDAHATRRAATGRSSAPSRAASIPRWPRPSSTGRSATA